MSKQLSVVQRLLLPNNGHTAINSTISPINSNALQLPVNEKTTASNISVGNSIIMSTTVMFDNNSTTSYFPTISSKESSTVLSSHASPKSPIHSTPEKSDESAFLSTNIQIDTMNTSSPFNITMTKEARERVQSYIENIDHQQENLKATEKAKIEEEVEQKPNRSVDSTFEDASSKLKQLVVILMKLFS